MQCPLRNHLLPNGSSQTSHGRQRSVSAWIRTALLTAALMIPVPMQPAHARDVQGCSMYSDISLGGETLPGGVLCMNLRGRGTYIRSMSAVWTAPMQCNWRIDWVIYYRGKVWWRSRGPNHDGCSYIKGWRNRGAGYAPSGSDLCGELYNTASNVKIDAACLAISNSWL